ncbi:DUF4153 domain-containing protein [Caulobacter sp. 602-2]|uniref:DUF4153 domain-containing protein n=1 Tax=Caulobacter sp. 602-2 TaxID=2710887 RepID=A0A6G4R484_9CAUL|nr:DUF4153 domain-containing protein [Caulobacter sp. 602-2]NGM52601.1 DUF4153 domain-containing protein [Caulobacter sp. 602-2]
MTEPAPETVDLKAQRRVAGLRLVTGLVQGLLLFGLVHAADHRLWPATSPVLFMALAAGVFFTPFVVLAGLSTMRLGRLAIWKLVAFAVAAGLTGDAANAARLQYSSEGMWPNGVVVYAVAALLFIGHHLVQPAEMERRPIARFTTYFDETWKHGVQLALSILFTGAFWLLLVLASALFSMIGVDAIKKLIERAWFGFPATAVMFAAAVQLTDVRAGLVRGVRTVSLTLLAWLLPLMALIAAGFLATLPFQGLALLWATKKAAALLLTAAAALIVLTNAAYQDGTEQPPKVLAWAARIAGLLLAPITILAAYAIWLRVDQYGFTPDRVYGGACVIVAAGYAVGYAIAALKPGAWMKPLEATNIAMAFVAIAVLLALFTPLADPARLSVNSQVARLEAGKVKPEAFDFEFLRLRSGQRGVKAIEALEKHADPAIARAARAAPKTWQEAADRRAAARENPIFANANKAALKKIQMLPAGQVLPADFAAQFTAVGAPLLSGCSLGSDSWCIGTLVQVDGAGDPELLMSSGYDIVIHRRDETGRWREYGQVSLSSCPTYNIRDVFAAGQLKPLPSSLPDLEIAGQRHHMTLGQTGCERREPPEAKLAPPPGKPRGKSVNLLAVTP